MPSEDENPWGFLEKIVPLQEKLNQIGPLCAAKDVADACLSGEFARRYLEKLKEEGLA